MKKYIKKLTGIFLGFILCYYNVCVGYESPIHLLAVESMLHIRIIIIVFITMIISYIILKIIAKKEKRKEQINKYTQKKISKYKKFLSICIFVLTIMIITIVFIAIMLFSENFIFGDIIKSKTLENYNYEEHIKSGFLNKTELAMFNSQYELFERYNQKADFVKYLYYQVINNNEIYEKKGIPELKVSIFGVVTVDKDNSFYELPTLSKSKLYNIKMNYNKFGMIESIYIEEAN